MCLQQSPQLQIEPMAFLDDIFGALSSVLPRRGRKPKASLQGSRIPLTVGAIQRYSLELEVPDVAIRPINQSLETSYDLLEMMHWSYEVKNGLEYIARDVFCDASGRVGSWSVGPDIESGRSPHPDVVAIATDLGKRYSGKTMVLGGSRLARAAIESLGLGDACMELAIEKEGIGRNDYGISNSLYIPPLTVFIDEGVDGQLNGYWQRQKMTPSDGDRFLHPVKTLWFSYNKRGLYGSPSTLPSVPTWQKLKKCASDVEEAARANGIIPWLHIMPDDRGEDYKESYKQEYQSLRSDGIITDLFLSGGADVRKAATGTASIQSLIDYWLQLRYQMVPPGVPLWFYPGLGMDSATGKELANQPAAAYIRMVNSLRGMIGEEIRWAINLELILKRGIEFMLDNQHYDVVWPELEVIPVTTNDVQKQGKKKEPEEDEDPNDEGAEEDSDRQTIDNAIATRLQRNFDSPHETSELERKLAAKEWALAQGDRRG